MKVCIHFVKIELLSAFCAPVKVIHNWLIRTATFFFNENVPPLQEKILKIHCSMNFVNQTGFKLLSYPV